MSIRASKEKKPDDLVAVVSHNDGDLEEISPRTETERGLKSRHAQMIALGGTIGTGLFVGTGQGLHIGGPLFLLLAYLTITILVYGISSATTEMASYLPIPGSNMAVYAKRYVSPSAGFALGWMYWYIFAITVPAELTATGIVVSYWHPPVNVGVWITIALLIVTLINCFPVKFYGEAEFWFASLKVFGIMGLLIMAVVLIFGGGPNHQMLGFHYWKHPGPVNEYAVGGASGRLCAFLGVLIFSVFAFAFAPELLVVTAGEMRSPRKNLPKAGRRYFYRLVVFYVLGVFAIGMIVGSDNKNLLGGGSGAGSSPWALAAKDAGIRGLDSVINAIIVTSACSAANSYFYMSSRALYSMALMGNAPKIFTRCNRYGIPYYCNLASFIVSLLGYLNLSNSGATVFNWFVNLINAGAFESWAAICFIYIRYRKATEVQGVKDLPYRSRFQPYMAYVSGTMFTLLLLLNGFTVFINGHWNVSSFITSYIGIPILVVLWLGHKLTKGRNDPLLYAPHQIDLKSGLDEVIAHEELMMETRRSSVYDEKTKWFHKFDVVFE